MLDPNERCALRVWHQPAKLGLDFDLSQLNRLLTFWLCATVHRNAGEQPQRQSATRGRVLIPAINAIPGAPCPPPGKCKELLPAVTCVPWQQTAWNCGESYCHSGSSKHRAMINVYSAIVATTPNTIRYSILFTSYLSLHQKLPRSARPRVEI